MTSQLVMAYADPPYLGNAWRYDHPDAARWNDPTEHAALMAGMDANYDAWALSCNSTDLATLLPLAPPGVRVAAWVKPFAAFRANVRVAYTWEPVLWRRIAPRRPGDPVGRDHLAEPITLRRGLVGAKPERFVSWVCDVLGWQLGDTLDDLFPGTGVVGRVVGERLL